MVKLYKRVPKGTIRLEIEHAVYVPSTKNINQKISEAEFKKRVITVRNYMRQNFYGSTSVKGIGNYSDKTNRSVDEKVVRVVNFADDKVYKQKRQQIITQVRSWGRQWGQESIGYEVEGDMYYISTAPVKMRKERSKPKPKPRNKIPNSINMFNRW